MAKLKRAFLILGFVLCLFVIAKSQRSSDIVKIHPNKNLEQFMSNFNSKFIDSLVLLDKTLFFSIPINDSMDVQLYIHIEESQALEKINYNSKNKYPYLIKPKEYSSIKTNKILEIYLVHSLSFEFSFKKSDEEYKRRKAKDTTFKGELWEYYNK